MEEIENIVPCTWVGLNMSGEATIKDGYLKINNISIYKLSELKALSSNGSYNPEEDLNPSEDFVMEPGRTMFVHMRLCNKAKVCTQKFVNSVVITNENSKVVTSENGESLAVSIGPASRRRKRDLPAISVETSSGKLAIKGLEVFYHVLTILLLNTTCPVLANSVDLLHCLSLNV